MSESASRVALAGPVAEMLVKALRSVDAGSPSPAAALLLNARQGA